MGLAKVFPNNDYYNVCLIILEVVLASSPPDEHNWIGNIESVLLDTNGGVFYSRKHGVTVTFPEGAIESGIKAELKFGATLLAPVKFSKNALPVSAVFWLCMNVTLQKPVQIQIPHYINIKSKTQADNLQFAKVFHFISDESMMEVVRGGKFAVGKSFGSIEVDHFCYVCVVNKYYLNNDDYKYQAILFQKRQIHDCVWKLDICIMAALPTCEQVIILSYSRN